MLAGMIKAVLLMTVITFAWLSVQRWWQRSFPELSCSEDDALANRGGCHNCTCGKQEAAMPDSVPNRENSEVTENASGRL